MKGKFVDNKTRSVKRLIINIAALIFLLLSIEALAQKDKKKLKKAGVVQLNDSLTTYSQSDIFNFPNLNKIRYYNSPAELKEMQKADKNSEEMYLLLKSYVSNFGLENFSANAPMVWALAKLSEKYGPKGEAILLYKMVLKHHQQGINTAELFKKYDSIETDKKQYYVPLDFYYELVNYRKEIDTLRPPQSVLVNMGYEINSPKEDYGPTIGNVDYVLLYTSKRNSHEQRAFDEDIFYSVKVDGVWTEAKEFRAINTVFNEGSACLSMDGKQLFFSRCNTPDGLGNCDIYVAKLKKDSVWTDIENLGPIINSAGWDSHPSLTHGGDTLFFASNRVGGMGLSDIYYSVRDRKGEWTEAKNAGPVINTRHSEVSPFFHHTYNVLYFSSNGHPLNFGEFDIYKSVRMGVQWSEPKNIGPLVNGVGSEYYFTIDSKSQELYYARSTEDDLKNLDLYSFPVPMEAQPLATTNLKGSLKDQSGKPMKGIVSIIDLDKGVEVAPKFLKEDGTFDFSLINKRNYLIIIQGDDFFRIEEIFFLDGDKEINKIAEPIESKIAFASLEFENGKADILETMHSDLNKLGNFLLDHPEVNLKISGHTDSAGREEANLRLSQARADAIKAYLHYEYKIDVNRVTAIGYGSSKPVAKELSDDHKQLNRRVEFEIFKQ
jgi:Outer membrane protein and related peptidoglycan-associated (lipo)proteins